MHWIQLSRLDYVRARSTNAVFAHRTTNWSLQHCGLVPAPNPTEEDRALSLKVSSG